MQQSDGERPIEALRVECDVLAEGIERMRLERKVKKLRAKYTKLVEREEDEEAQR